MQRHVSTVSTPTLTQRLMCWILLSFAHGQPLLVTKTNTSPPKRPLKMPKWAETNKKPSLLKQGPNFLSSAFPGGSAVKNLLANAGDADLITGSRRSPGEGNSYPLQNSSPEIPWTEEPGGLQSMGSQRVWLNWAHTHLSLKMNPLVHVLEIYMSLSLFSSHLEH